MGQSFKPNPKFGNRMDCYTTNVQKGLQVILGDTVTKGLVATLGKEGYIANAAGAAYKAVVPEAVRNNPVVKAVTKHITPMNLVPGVIQYKMISAGVKALANPVQTAKDIEEKAKATAKAAEAAALATARASEAAAKATKAAAEAAARKAQEAARATKIAAELAARKTKEAAELAARKTREAAELAARRTREAAEAAARATANAAKKTWNVIKRF
jgi:hypothetical protein